MNLESTISQPPPKLSNRIADPVQLTSPGAHQILDLITRLNLRPYKGCGELGSAVLSAWRRGRAKEAGSLNCVGLDYHGSLVAVGSWVCLAWDSAQLGMSAARVDVLLADPGYGAAVSTISPVLDKVVHQCKGNGVRYLTARVDIGDLASIHSLQCQGFSLIDGIQTFVSDLTCETEPHSRSVEAMEVALLAPWQRDQVIEIARTAYRFDRFHSDPALHAGVADALHMSWLRNSCDGLAADAVVTAHKSGEVFGFVTLKFDQALIEIGGPAVATIVLIAVKETGRGLGVGLALTAWTMRWLKARGVNWVTVGTQLANVPAARLYERIGFRYAGSCLTFRKLL